MGCRSLAFSLSLAVVLLTAACAAPAGPVAQDDSSADVPKPTGPKRIVAAIMGDAHTVYTKLNPGMTVPGIDALEHMVGAGLAVVDNEGNLRPRLAATLPTIENELWRVLPDGRMETTWQIREGARWHDATPLTTDDLLFTASIGQQKGLRLFTNAAYDAVEDIEAMGPAAVTVRWKRPFVQADMLFSGPPLPRHVLQQLYEADRLGFPQLSYWSEEYMGTGPYKVRHWVRGSHVLIEAFEQYALGRPRIDEIEVKFIPDSNTLAANILAGTVELTMGRTLSLEQAVAVRDQWTDGRTDVAPSNLIRIYPQLLTPNPPVVANLEFRRALMYATDRQQLVESIQAGLALVAHSYLDPNQPAFRELEARLLRYEYDPRKAAELIEGLGYHRGADAIFPDAAGLT